MLNHFHCIIEIIVGADSISALESSAPESDSISAQMDRRSTHDSAPTGPTLSNVIQTFKRHTTIKYIEMVKSGIVPPFDRRIWQRNYWEYIVRNEREFQRILEYIDNNPKNWHDDKLNAGIGNVVLEDQRPYNKEIWMV